MLERKSVAFCCQMWQEGNRNRCRTAKLPGLGSDKLAEAFCFLATTIPGIKEA